MKKTAFFAAMLAAAAFFCTSCLKDDAKYPERLEGDWLRFEGSTGYTYLLSIEELDGGQYAYYRIISPTKVVEETVEGTLYYDNESGKGYIDSDVYGGAQITLQAYRDETDDCGLLNVTRTVIEGGEENSVTRVLASVSKSEYVVLHTGTWEGSSSGSAVQADAVMNITSIIPVGGKCGTLDFTISSSTVSCDIESVSALILTEPENAVGIITAKLGADSFPIVMGYNIYTKVITLYSDYGIFTMSPVVTQ